MATAPDPTQADPIEEALANLQAEDTQQAAGLPSPITANERPPEARGGGQAPAADEGAFASGLRGVADAVSFGFGDEAGGLFDSLGVPDPSGSSHETIFNSNRDFASILAGNVAKERGLLAGDRQNHGIAATVGGLAGGLLIPFGAGARGALQVAKVGAIQGAIYGLGSGEGVEGRAEGAAEGGVVGGVVGGLLGRFLPGLRKPAVTAGAEEAAGATARGAEGSAIEPIPESTAPTAVSQDGTAYATTLPDGSKLRGFDGEGRPQYEAPVAATPEGETPSAAPVDDTPIPLEAPPTTEGGQPTPVGSIGRSQLEALKTDVANFRESIAYGGDRQADITRAGTPEAAAQVGEFRIGNLGDNLDTTSLLSALARELPQVAAKSDEELAASARVTAASIGEDPEAMLAWARTAAGQLGDVDNTMMALRSVWAQTGKQVDEIHLAGVDWSQADDSTVYAAGQAVRNLTELSQQIQIAKTGLGRGLRVNSLPDAETYLTQLMGRGEEGAVTTRTDAAPKGVPPVGPREVPPLPRNRQELKDWFDLWGMTEGSPRSRADFLQGRLTIPTPNKFLRTSFPNFFTASILSAPKTVAMNIVGPAFISLIRNAERFGGAAAGALNPLATAEERATMREVARQTPIAYMKTLGDIGDALRYGMQAFDTNKSIIGGGGYNVDQLTTYGPITAKMGRSAGMDTSPISQAAERFLGNYPNLQGMVGPNTGYTLGNLINVFPKAFARINNGLDEAAKRLAYMGEVRVRAQVEAAGQGLSGDDFQAFVHQKMTGSFDAVGHAQDEDLLRQAERTTFTSQVGEEGGQVRKAASFVQALRSDIPEMRYIVPVFNVPANALGETLRRLPIAAMTRGFDKVTGAKLTDSLGFAATAADLAGENGPIAQAEAHGRTMLGASFITAGIMMNRMGILTGAGPQEATDRKVWLQTHQPYSIRVGDEWVRYDKFDILGGLLSIPSTISDASTYRAADQGIGDMMMSGVGAMAQWFKDKASLKTATSLLNAGSDPTSDFGSMMSQFASSTAAGFIPAAVRTLTVDTDDPYVRMRRSWTDYLKASLPGLSQTLEPTRNVLGEPIQRSADTFAEAVLPVTMQSAVTFKEDPVMDELDRLYQVTGYGAGADPKSLGYGFFNPKDVKLEDGRSIYDRGMQKRMTLELGGQTLKQSLNALFNSKDYNVAIDADPGQSVTSLGAASRGFMVKRVFDQYNKAAKAELANESPLADKYLTAAAAKQRDDGYLRQYSAEDLVKTPHLYQDNGLDPASYSEKIRGGAGGSSDPLASALGL